MSRLRALPCLLLALATLTSAVAATTPSSPATPAAPTAPTAPAALASLASLASSATPATPTTPATPAKPLATPANWKVAVQAAPGDTAARAWATFPDGTALVIFRAKTVAGAHDLHFAQWRNGQWSEPRVIEPDGWKTDAPPATPPALATRDGQASAAWFTAADNDPRILVALSSDAGRVWQLPQRVSEGRPEVAVAVAVTLLRDGSQVACWQEGAQLLLRRISPQNDLNPLVPVAESRAQVAALQLSVLADQDEAAPIRLLLAYTASGRALTAVVTLPSLKALTEADSACDCAKTAPGAPHGFAMRGEVISANAAKGLLLVKHDEIPGVMPAMTMAFKADATAMQVLAPGREFLGRMEERNGEWWLFDVRVLGATLK